MRIGIFGGSFNPPHQQHFKIAENLVKNNHLDKIIFVPTGNSYKKDNLILDEHRYKMLKLMINNYLYLDVSNYEFKKLTYTYETLDYFKESYPNDQIYFICGSDNLSYLDKWKNYEYILSNYKIIVTLRNNDNKEELLNKFKNFKDKIIFVDIPLYNISSTEIRNRIINNNNLDNMINDKIRDYIIEYNLYK